MLLGQKGMNMAERVVLEMGYVWNPMHIESGIDAVIEIRNVLSGTTKNRIVQAQVKAVTKFAAEQGDAFSFSCERAHIAYWLGGTARVILIVCRPQTGEIYWKDLTSYFSLPENRERCTVRFSKESDVFSVGVRSALLTVAKPEGGLALGPVPKREILGINLFPLKRYPKEILATPTKSKGWDEFFTSLKAMQRPWLQEFVWKAGILYSFFDPITEGLGDLCASETEAFPTQQWSESNDPVLQRHFAELLRKAFEHRCYKRGVKTDRETGLCYFAAPPDGSELQITTKSLVNITAKTVVSRHSSMRPDGTTSVYFKHYAFESRIRRFSNEWFLELTPTFFFSEDGKTPHPNAEALLSGIKRIERHQAVLGVFLTWKEFLTEDTLFNSCNRFLTVLPPEGLPIDGGIDDRAWRTTDVLGDEGQVVAAEVGEAGESFDEEEGGLFLWKPS